MSASERLKNLDVREADDLVSYLAAFPALIAVVEAAEEIALRPTASTALDLDIALAALDHALGSDWPKAGYDKPMFRGKP